MLKKTMTRAEKLDALKCLIKDYGRKPKAVCENCRYIDFCFDMKRFIGREAKKYV